MAKRYRSRALSVVHETAAGLREAGALDERAMKKFDKICLAPIKLPSTKRTHRPRIRRGS